MILAKHLKTKQNVNAYVDKLKIENISIQPAEVFDIILNKNHSDYVNENSIGVIKFKFIVNKYDTSHTYYASPLDKNHIKVPLKHEIVLITNAPSTYSGTIKEESEYYYSGTINIWNLINNNILPYSSRPQEKEKNIDKYKNKSIEDKFNTSDVAEYFSINNDKPSLNLYEGDYLIQGRTGSSIRFSNSFKKSKNSWSINSKDDNPIIILRADGKENINSNIDEDINSDASSIYICGDQSIPIQHSYSQLNSYQTKPKLSSNFIGKQIIINSDRIVINSKNDHLFLSSKKTLSLSSNDTINIDSKNKTIIGDVNKSEKAIKGETTYDFIKELFDTIESSTIPTPAGPVKMSLAPEWIAFKLKWTLNPLHSSINKDTDFLSDKLSLE